MFFIKKTSFIQIDFFYQKLALSFMNELDVMLQYWKWDNHFSRTENVLWYILNQLNGLPYSVLQHFALVKQANHDARKGSKEEG